MSKIKNWVRRLLGYGDRRLAQAVRCPQCEHSTLEASPECHCWDPGCLCVILHETSR